MVKVVSRSNLEPNNRRGKVIKILMHCAHQSSSVKFNYFLIGFVTEVQSFQKKIILEHPSERFLYLFTVLKE